MELNLTPNVFGALKKACRKFLPGVVVRVDFVEGLHDEEHAWGRTHFDETPVVVEVDAACPYRGVVDVITHEIAHVMAGYEAGHGPAWERARDMLLAELKSEIDHHGRTEEGD